MSDYTITTDFSVAKSGAQIVGADLDVEFDAIQVAIATKAEAVGPFIAVNTNGTFTPTWGTGFSSDPTGDLRFQIIDEGTHDIVFISDDTGAVMTGTSDTTAMSITGIPAAIRPDVEVFSSLFVLTDAGAADKACFATISVAGVITFQVMNYNQHGTGGPKTMVIGSDGSDDKFTASSTKGLPAGWWMMYERIRTA